MNITPEFETIWNRVEDFEIAKEVIHWCPYARKFARWSATLIESSQDLNVVIVNQAKIQLIDKYFEWRIYVPKNHRNHIGPRGHRCIYHVFEQTYEKLRLIELALKPPLLFIPPPPSPPVQYSGIFLGEFDE